MLYIYIATIIYLEFLCEYKFILRCYDVYVFMARPTNTDNFKLIGEQKCLKKGATIKK